MRPQLRHALGLAALVPLASAALAQTLPPPGPRLFDQGRTDVQPPSLRSDAPPAPANPTPGSNGAANGKGSNAGGNPDPGGNGAAHGKSPNAGGAPARRDLGATNGNGAARSGVPATVPDHAA